MPRHITTLNPKPVKKDTSVEKLAAISSQLDALSGAIANIKPAEGYDDSQVLQGLADVLKQMQEYQLQLMKDKKPKKWDFKVSYGMLGKIKNVEAVAVD